MHNWLRCMGFFLGLPFALASVVITMFITVFTFIFMPLAWTLSCCSSCCCPYHKMREVVKILATIHLYVVGWFTCDPLWSSEPVIENRQDYQHHYPPQDDVVRMAPQLSPPLPITTIGSKNSSSPKSLTVSAGLTKRSFTYQELVIATNNFSAVNLLGEGGFSHVYKGTLSNGTEAAIKRLKDTTSKQTDVEFMKEADILSLVHHRHLVSLIGCCITEGNWLLVCEYVPNKTLKFHLHDREQPTLAWKDRFRIALDSAKGLAYLHEDCQPRVIHRDIKAANILLDHSFRAKIADFGIAKHFSDEKTHISTAVKGTHGYLSPEYVSSGKLTDKSDVFSYGVLLLELITGRRPVHLADWARPLLKQALEDGKYDVLVDPFLESYYNPIELGRMVACAYACLCHSASLRPSMSQIVRALEGLISLGEYTIQVQPSMLSANILYHEVSRRSSRSPLSPPPPKTPSTRSPPRGPSSSSSSSISTPLVVGVAVGGLAILLLLSFMCVCCWKKKRQPTPLPHYSGAPPPPPPGRKDERYGEYWQQNAPLPADHAVKLPPGPPLPFASRPPHSPGHLPPPPPPPMISSSGGSGSNYSGSEAPLPPPSPSVALGLSKSTFTYEELALATDGFSDANLLGQGGFGYVHRGVLPNGNEVAVKQLKTGSGQGEREFHAEVEIITRVHHKHLVSLVGYCISGGKRLLVYEYVPNNTLEFHLHGRGRPTMEWPTRLKIALGSAKGLAYLHEDCHPKIIHRDIKSANILLDYKFVPKVADFGLAKFASDNKTHVSTRVMGTFGYLAPEYASSGKLTDRSDVFSFGVMLLELITGRRPVDPSQSFMDDSLVDWARPLLTRALEDGNYDALVDPKLGENFNPNEMAHMIACAAACLRHLARRRPRMGQQIVRALEGDVSLEDLNKGIRPGHSRLYSSYDSSGSDSGRYNEVMKKFRKLALMAQEYASSENNAPQNPSASSGEDQHPQETEMGKKERPPWL
ncbi:unnamed protein product [Musa hybrid cultivar]